MALQRPPLALLCPRLALLCPRLALQRPLTHEDRSRESEMKGMAQLMQQLPDEQARVGGWTQTLHTWIRIWILKTWIRARRRVGAMAAAATSMLWSGSRHSAGLQANRHDGWPGGPAGAEAAVADIACAVATAGVQQHDGHNPSPLCLQLVQVQRRGAACCGA